MDHYQPLPVAVAAGKTTVGALFHNTARGYPDRLALVDGQRRFTYREIEALSNRWSNFLLAKGLKRGDRVAVLLRNCAEYFLLELAAAKTGIILAALNWRLTERELTHCISLVRPKLVLTSDELKTLLDRCDLPAIECLVLGAECDAALLASRDDYPDRGLDPEEGLIILYTSGTTGLPKGALISHRAMMARGLVYHMLFHVPDQDNFIAWTPMYHMVATDHGLATLMRGGTVWCVDGYQPEQLAELVGSLRMNWLVLVPGMVAGFVDWLAKAAVKPKGVNIIGAMPDLVPREDIAAATRYFNAPFLNTFGATETGLPPGTGGRISVGIAPERLSKTQSPFCDLRLLDPNGREVPVGEPGEAALAGPTLFSGYWENDEVNREDFRDGRFHMGDVLRCNSDGTLDYVDRVKYMIKSGGENIYPAEIESIIVEDPRVESAVVVRRPDERWGEVPVVLVVRREEGITSREIISACRDGLASYKCPKAVYFIEDSLLPRSTTGKIQRHLLEGLLAGLQSEPG